MPDFNAYPALSIKTINPVSALSDAQAYQSGQIDLQQKSAFAPLQLQEAQDEANVRHTQYGNSALAQAADEALASDPDKAPAAWDASMNKLAGEGFGIARQYVGRYDADTAKKVRDTFGTRSGGTTAADQKIDQQQQAQAQQVVSQMTPDQASQALTNMNMGKELLRGVNSAETFSAAIDKARKAGLQVDKLLSGRDLTGSSPLTWQSNYAAIQKVLNDQEPTRKALEQRVGNEALGIPDATPQDKLINAGGGNIYNQTKGQWITPPQQASKDQYEYLSPDKTGGAPGRFNKATGQAEPLTGPDNYSAVADKIIGTERALRQMLKIQTLLPLATVSL